MGSARMGRKSRWTIGRRTGIIVAMIAAVVLLMGFAGMAIAEMHGILPRALAPFAAQLQTEQ